MKWRDDELVSPFSGKVMRRDSPHSLTDGAERFPLIEEIPFLRGGREKLIAEVLKKLDDGDERAALILLFKDQDDWARTLPPDDEDLQPLFDDPAITLREAMRCLKYEAVADYFAYRWSDPTFLSGLKLLEAHLSENTVEVFELACGIGHFLRELARTDIRAVGADVVFSKLWLARKFVAPEAKLVCADASFALPFADNTFDAAFCHDAFYFLPEKQSVAGEFNRVTREMILIGHAHNRNAENFSSGAAVSVAEYAAMFDDVKIYDDTELTAAYIENRAARSQTVAELEKCEAISLASGADDTKRKEFPVTCAAENLCINPLLIDEKGEIKLAPQYPSERYRAEYAPLSSYLNLTGAEAGRLRTLSIGELSGEDFADFVRRRILLNLPEKW